MKKKLLKIFLFFFVGVTIITTIVFFFVLPTPSDFKYSNDKKLPILIAHAGGGIDGKTYTNSEEAVRQSLQNGYDFIELDLFETSDHKIVSLHELAEFNTITGFENYSNPLTSKEFKSRKIYGTLQPLLAEDINRIFENSDTYLVTDKVDDPDLINKALTVNKEKMLTEVFSYEAYVKALDAGFKYPMLSIWGGKNLKKYWILLVTKKVKMITIPTWMIDSNPEDIQYLHDKGIIIFAFTANDKEYVLKNKETVTGFYTDSLTYNDLYNYR